MTVGEFCRKHGACKGGRKWAYRQLPEKRKAEMRDIYPLLLHAPDNEWFQWTIFESNLLTKDELNEFARWAALQVAHLIQTNETDKNLIIKYLETGDETIRTAARASRDASRAAASDAVSDAAGAASWTAAWDVRAAAWDAAINNQNKWLWERFGNIFEREAL